MNNGTWCRVKKTEKILPSEMVVFAFVFLASMNFRAKYFYLIFIAFFVLLFINGFKLLINKSIVILSMLTVSLFIQDLVAQEGFNEVVKNLVFPMSYMLGYGLAAKACGGARNKLRNERLLKVGVLSVALGNITHIILNMSVNIRGGIVSVGRNSIDFWSRESYSATGQAALFVACIGVAIAVLFSDASVKAKICAAAMGIIIFLYNLILACRTPFALAAIVILVAAWNLFIRAEHKGSKEKAMLTAVIVFAVVAFAYEMNFFDIRERIASSNLFVRFADSGEVVTSDSRLDIRLNYIKEIWFHPFGGSVLMKKYGYAHDFFFDTWDKAGVIAAVMILCYLINTVVRLFRMLKRNQCSFLVQQLILCVFCAHYIEFLVEPIMYGMPWLFSTFCILDGIVSGMEL